MKFVTTFQKSISTTKDCLSIQNEGNTFNLMSKNSFLMSIACLSIFLISPLKLNSLDTDIGKDLFKNYCAGCHINGGNIIRRGKNLKISSLKRNGIDNPETIAKIAREGIGIMDGYKNQIGDNGDLVVAYWIWEQAQKAWVQE